MSARDAAIAAEVPVALAYNGVSHVVMMSSPSDLADFAIGFSLSEGILGAFDELWDLEVEEGETGIRVSMAIAAERFAELKNRRRNMSGRTGCGLCGVDDLTQVARPLPRVGAGVKVGIDAVHRALDALPAWQPANEETGAVHAAAWATPTGEIALAREDVGRHNALDKLIGKIAFARQSTQDGFVFLSSRASYELIRKAARVDVPMIATISAPTSLAINIAKQAGIRLVAFARGDGFVEYAPA